MTDTMDRVSVEAARNMLESVMLPMEEARSLPFAAYRDQGFFDLEMERVFRNDWVAVCAEASLAEPGDCLALDIGGEPVLLVRGSDGQLRALSNVCRHRGTLLMEPGIDRLDGGRIVCPYHAWSYSDAGQFRGAPFSRGVSVDSGEHSLPSFRVEVWMGVVFICLEERTPPLANRLKGIESHLEEFGMETFRVAAPFSDPEVWAANWKLIVENGIESYHLFQVHANTLEKITPTRGAYYIEGSAKWTVTGGAIVEGGGAGLAGKLLGSLLGSDTGGDHYTLVSIPPSFVGVVTRDSWDWLVAHPLTPNSTRVLTGSLTKGKPDVITRMVYGGYASAFLEEDRAICERAQRGMAARHSKGGKLVPLERVVVDFHHYLGWRMLGEEPPPRHVERKP